MSGSPSGFVCSSYDVHCVSEEEGKGREERERETEREAAEAAGVRAHATFTVLVHVCVQGDRKVGLHFSAVARWRVLECMGKIKNVCLISL